MATRQAYKTTFEPENVIRPIHTGGSVSVSDEARILATTLGDDAILTDPASGHRLAQIEGDGDSITCLILTPSGSHLAICSRSLGMRLYRLQLQPSLDGSGDVIEVTRTRSLRPHPVPVTILAVDPTGTLLATGGTDGVIKVWDIAGGYTTHTFHGPGGLVTALHFYEAALGRPEPPPPRRKRKSRRDKTNGEGGSDGEGYTTAHDAHLRLLSAGREGKIKVWDLRRRSAVATLESHVSDVTALDYSPEADAILSAARDKTLIWWDARSWKIRRVVPCLESVEAAGFADGGRLTYSAGAGGNVRVWDSETGREMTAERAKRSDEDAIVAAVYRQGVLPFILCVQADHTLALYRVPETSTAATPPELVRRICGTHDEIIDLRYVLPDRSVMALATNAEEVRLVSVARQSCLYFGQDVGALKGHTDMIVTLDVDQSGCWIATGAKDNTAKVWRIDPADLSHSTCHATFSGHAESVGAVAFSKTTAAPSSSSPPEPPAFLLTGSQDQTIKKWDMPREARRGGKAPAAAARALFTRKAHDKDINAIDVHHAGRLFASASQDKTIKIWSVEEGEVQGILRGHRRGVWSVQFAPPGTATSIRDDGGADVSAGSAVMILTASGDRTVKLWSLADYSCVRTFEGHANTVLRVAWLRPSDAGGERGRGRGRVLFASAGGDGLVKVWDAGSGEVECTLDNHEDRVWALAVHPDTDTIVSAGSDSVVTFWRDTSAETQLAAARAAQRLVEQEQELENYIRADAYREAIVLALQLNHPGRLLAIFTSVVMTAAPERGSLSGMAAVDAVLADLSDDQLFALLLRLRDWNTNARTAPVAQRVLHVLVQSYPAARLSGLASAAGGAKGGRRQGHRAGVGEVLGALRAYTERHYRRVDELVDESYLVEYTLREMDALVEEHGERGDVIMGVGA